MVGGGATGVELAGALAELRSTALDAAFPEVNLASVRIRLVEQADALLLPFEPRLREYARRQLEARGVEVRLKPLSSRCAATGSSWPTGRTCPATSPSGRPGCPPPRK